MLQILRIIFMTAVVGWLSWFLGKTVIVGIRTGTIRHTDSTRVCRRSSNPIGYWFLVVLFSAFVAMLTGVWWWAVGDALRHLK